MAVSLVVLVVEASPAGAAFPGPNGQIAYASLLDGDYEIYTINPTGGTPVQVAHNTSTDNDAEHAPNGRKIAYTGTATATTRFRRSTPPGDAGPNHQ